MIVNVYMGSKIITKVYTNTTVNNIRNQIQNVAGIPSSDYYILQNGKLLENDSPIGRSDIHAVLRQVGGKGGFGSMLRAIGAQIEKTTNREACRDLSGRRLRDINEEKRLKTWLDNQKDRESEAAERKQKKLQRLLTKPKHEFKDEEYEQARTELTSNVGEAVEEGFKKAAQIASCSSTDMKNSSQKRKHETNKELQKKKKKKTALWIADDLSSSTDTDEEDSESESNESNKSSKELVKTDIPIVLSKQISDNSNQSSSSIDK